MKYMVLLGRVFYALFIMASLNHFKAGTVGYAAGQGVPMASVLVPVSGVMALLGGLSILVGYKARWGAWLLVAFLVPVTLTMHRFWRTDPQMTMMQQAMFMKNLSMLGAALLITHFGAGPLSLDAQSSQP